MAFRTAWNTSILTRWITYSWKLGNGTTPLAKLSPWRSARPSNNGKLCVLIYLPCPSTCAAWLQVSPACHGTVCISKDTWISRWLHFYFIPTSISWVPSFLALSLQNCSCIIRKGIYCLQGQFPQILWRFLCPHLNRLSSSCVWNHSHQDDAFQFLTNSRFISRESWKLSVLQVGKREVRNVKWCPLNPLECNVSGRARKSIAVSCLCVHIYSTRQLTAHQWACFCVTVSVMTMPKEIVAFQMLPFGSVHSSQGYCFNAGCVHTWWSFFPQSFPFSTLRSLQLDVLHCWEPS